MKNTKLQMLMYVGIVGMMLSGTAEAQYFGSATATRPSPARQMQQPSAGRTQEQIREIGSEAATDEKYSAVEPVEAKEDDETVEKQNVSTPFDYAYGKTPEKKKQAPAKQLYRRYSTVGGVTVETDEENEEDELIMLYMKNFSVYRSPSGQTRCSARFAVLTTLPVKLSNISYRLKWPNMETVLSFSDVEPGVENHFDYGLLGDGCFSMDRQPNIVVNRCRAKGMTQRECAAKIRWIKEI